MDPAKYEYQSDFARRYVAQGRQEGREEGLEEGRREVIARQLALGFGLLPADAISRISSASIAELDVIAERLLTADSIAQALGS